MKILVPALLCLALLAAWFPTAYAQTAAPYQKTIDRFEGKHLHGPIHVEYEHRCQDGKSPNIKRREIVTLKFTYKRTAYHILIHSRDFADGQRIAGQIIRAIRAKRLTWIDAFRRGKKVVAGYRFIEDDLKCWEEKH